MKVNIIIIINRGYLLVVGYTLWSKLCPLPKDYIILRDHVKIVIYITLIILKGKNKNHVKYDVDKNTKI